MNSSGRSSGASSGAVSGSGRLSLPSLPSLSDLNDDAAAPKPHFDFDNDDIDVALRVDVVDSNHNSSIYDPPPFAPDDEPAPTSPRAAAAAALPNNDDDDDSSTSSEVFLNLDDSHKTSLSRAAAAQGSRASGSEKTSKEHHQQHKPDNMLDVVVQGLSRPRANTRVLVVDESTAHNVILAHVDSDEESDHDSAAAPSEHHHPTSEFHKLPLNKSATSAAAAAAPAASKPAASPRGADAAAPVKSPRGEPSSSSSSLSSSAKSQEPPSSAKSPRGEPVIQFATDLCYRCKKLPYVLKMSIRVQDPVDHYKLVSFCTICAIAVQGDRVEATRVAGGDVERAIRDKAAQNALRKPCERCKKRPAHCVTDFDKKKRQLCCGVCFAEHKDFKKLSQFALSCVVNLDFQRRAPGVSRAAHNGAKQRTGALQSRVRRVAHTAPGGGSQAAQNGV
jgi:hypothetical protein